MFWKNDRSVDAFNAEFSNGGTVVWFKICSQAVSASTKKWRIGTNHHLPAEPHIEDEVAALHRSLCFFKVGMFAPTAQEEMVDNEGSSVHCDKGQFLSLHSVPLCDTSQTWFATAFLSIGDQKCFTMSRFAHSCDLFAPTKRFPLPFVLRPARHSRHWHMPRLNPPHKLTNPSSCSRARVLGCDIPVPEVLFPFSQCPRCPVILRLLNGGKFVLLWYREMRVFRQREGHFLGVVQILREEAAQESHLASCSHFGRE